MSRLELYSFAEGRAHCTPDECASQLEGTTNIRLLWSRVHTRPHPEG